MDSKVDDWARKGGLGLGFRGYNTPMPQGICRLENGDIFYVFSWPISRIGNGK